MIIVYDISKKITIHKFSNFKSKINCSKYGAYKDILIVGFENGYIESFSLKSFESLNKKYGNYGNLKFKK
jgi:hypothetical protein